MPHEALKSTLIITFTLIASVVLGKLIGGHSGLIATAMTFGFGLVLLTLVNTEAGLVVLILAMFLSPEITLAQVPGRNIVVRLDDLLLVVMFFTTLAKTAVHKHRALFIKTPLNLPLFVYCTVLFISSGLGIVRHIVNPATCTFYVLKYIEYYMLYFMVANVIENRRQIILFLKTGFITFFCVIIYAHSTMGQMPRSSAPFESGSGEPNTLGGYLIIAFALLFAFFAHYQKLKQKLLFVLPILLAVPVFIKTLSRASFIAFIPSFLCNIIFTKRNRNTLVIIGCLAMLVFPFMKTDLREAVTERVRYTTGRFAAMEFQILGRNVALEPSTGIRIMSWVNAYDIFLRNHPFFGYGASGVGMCDAQYPLVIGETGLFGIFSFMWILWRILSHSYKTYRSTDDPLFASLSLGLLSGLVGLMIQALGCNTFILIRVMEPFWFLTAIVMRLPDVLAQEAIKTDSTVRDK